MPSKDALQALHRAQRQQVENVNLSLVNAHQATLQKEFAEQLRVICPLYAVIVLEQSSYNQAGMRPQLRQDTLFFEALYRVGALTAELLSLAANVAQCHQKTCALIRWPAQTSTEAFVKSCVLVKHR